jgi:hypothetical protein
MASRRRAHRWSLAASPLAPSSVQQLILGGLAAMAPLIIVPDRPDDKPAKEHRARRRFRKLNWDSNTVLVYFAKF